MDPFHPKVIHKTQLKIFLSGAGAVPEILGRQWGRRYQEAHWGAQPPPRRLAKNGENEPLYFDFLLSRRRQGREDEAIRQEGERAGNTGPGGEGEERRRRGRRVREEKGA